MDTKSLLIEKIDSLNAKVAIIGLGYVGLPLAVEIAKAGFSVTGIDVDKKRVEMLNKGNSYIMDVPENDLKECIKRKKLQATTSYDVISEADCVSICVPTPLRKTKDPDISYILSAIDEVSKRLRKGQLILLESTSYPGTTEELFLPSLKGKGLQEGKDFFLAFSPERVDPGNKIYKTKNIPKVIGGITQSCTEVASFFYKKFIDDVFPVSSAKVAEMVKLLENTFRSVNIALVNELALMCNRMGIDVWEVIEAAATKPFGFMPFYPGPGLGGHCIPVDPYYLVWKARSIGFEPRFIEIASYINSTMPAYVVTRITDALNKKGKPVKGSKILIMGIAYKKDVSDTRESPALDIITMLEEKGAEISFSDPYNEMIKIGDRLYRSVKLTPEYLKKMDCVVIVTDHSAFDYKMIFENSSLIFDTRNALKRFKGDNIVKL